MLGADVGSGLADAISVRGGIAGLAIAAVLMLLGALVRRYDRGDAAALAAQVALTDRLIAERDRADQARVKAEADADAERDLRIRLQEYARHLEDSLGVPHRKWP